MPWLKRPCDFCDEPIYEGQPAVEMFFGELGPGKKSGAPIVRESQDGPPDSFVMHAECAVDFLLEGTPEGQERLRFCAGCGADMKDAS